MKPTKPRPWEAPGYSFQIPGWPPGFVPDDSPIGPSTVKQREAAQQHRQRQLAKGNTGTIGFSPAGLSPEAAAAGAQLVARAKKKAGVV